MRDRPVVHELDLHLRAEDTGRDLDAQLPQRSAEPLVERLGHLRARGVGEGRPVPLRRVGEQGELGDDERRAARVEQRAVELAFARSRRSAAARSFPRGERRRLVVAVGDPEQDADAGADRAPG